MGNLSTPKGVQRLQMALHAKAKAEAGYRFYAPYDKISREDILAHAYAQCRKTAPWCEEIPLGTFYHDHHHGHRPHVPQRVRKGPIR